MLGFLDHFASSFQTYRTGCREGPGLAYVVGDHDTKVAHSVHTGSQTVYWAVVDSTASRIDFLTLNCST